MTARNWRFVGLDFDHMHMGDLLRLVAEHSHADIAGLYHPTREPMAAAAARFGVPANRVYTDLARCLAETGPDVAIVCSRAERHADYVEETSRRGIHTLVEKPMASSLRDADRMISAADTAGVRLAINWPLAWYPPHRTAYRLVTEGAIGELIEVHYYDGNRGPLHHLADKVEVDPAEAARRKAESWWYRKGSGGSLLDYLGYGATLGTWFLGGREPIEVTCVVDQPAGLDVDEHSITVARYVFGLSRFETRWGTFTDPWTLQPQPKCGFVLVGTEGAIASYDYEPTISVQTRTAPEAQCIAVDPVDAGDPVSYVIACLDTGAPVVGPLSPAVSRIGQQIVDSAILSARERRTVPLVAT